MMNNFFQRIHGVYSAKQSELSFNAIELKLKITFDINCVEIYSWIYYCKLSHFYAHLLLYIFETMFQIFSLD